MVFFCDPHDVQNQAMKASKSSDPAKSTTNFEGHGSRVGCCPGVGQCVIICNGNNGKRGREGHGETDFSLTLYPPLPPDPQPASTPWKQGVVGIK